MCIIISITFAEYSACFRSLSFFEQDEIANSDYVRVYQKFTDDYQESNYTDEVGTYDAESFNQAYSDFVKQDIYKQIADLPAVDHVYSYCLEEYGLNQYNNVFIRFTFSDTDTYKLFNLSLSEGRWF